jgi:hypothetical protein
VRLNCIQTPTHLNPLAYKELAPVDPSAFSNACTGSSQIAQIANVEMLAAALLTLSPVDRARLATMLLEQAEGKEATLGDTMG